MAITKIHPIITTIGSSISYICDEKKTLDVHKSSQNLITCYGTNPYMAAAQFEFDLRKTRQGKGQNHLAYHIIQSFDPKDQISFEEAHKIGQEFCEKYLGNKYRCILSTHMDKNHAHNHIIFCAASFIDHKKLHDDRANMYKIRKISDEICVAHEKSIIKEPDKKKAKSYYEWKQSKKGNSWKDILFENMQSAIKESKSYEEFLQNMSDRGYDYKGEKIGENESKYLSFNNKNGQEKWTRVSEKNFGQGFTKEKIKERIDNKVKWLEQNSLKGKKSVKSVDYSKENIINTSEEKYDNNVGLKLWASRENMKVRQDILNRIGTISSAKDKVNNLVADNKAIENELKQYEAEFIKIAADIDAMEQYKRTEKISYHYQKSTNPDRYYREHENELLLFSHAVQQLKRRKLEPDKVDIEDLKDMREELDIKISDLKDQLNENNSIIKAINKDLEKLAAYDEEYKNAHDLHSIVENNKKKKNTEID